MKNKLINLISENADLVSIFLTIAYIYFVVLVCNEIIEQAFG